MIQMKENQKGKVVEVCSRTTLANRLQSMGIYKGREITKLSHFALNGPIAIKVGRATLALGRAMAGKIILEIE